MKPLQKLIQCAVLALTAGVLAFSAGCGSDGGASSSVDAENKEGLTGTEKTLVGVVTDEQREEWFNRANRPESLPLLKNEKVGDIVKSEPMEIKFRELPKLESETKKAEELPSTVPATIDDEEVKADFNFKNAAVADVVPVFSSLLKFNYVVEGNLGGSVTMSMHENITRRQLWLVFQQMLHLSGVVGDYRDDILHLRLASALPQELNLDASSINLELGIFRLKNSSPADIAAQIRKFLPRDIRAIELPKSATLLILDSPQAIMRLKMLIEELDQPAAVNLHQTLFPCNHIEPDQIVKELREILPLLGFPVSESPAKRNPGEITLTSLPRLQTIAVSAANSEAIKEIERWMDILDREDINQEELFIYEVVNSRAEELCRALSTMYKVTGSMIKQGSTRAEVVDVPTVNSPSTLAANTGASSGSVFDVPVRIWTDSINQRLSIRTTPRVYASIRAFLQRLDTIPAQVLLQVLVVEISLNDSVRFGVEFMQSALNQDNVNAIGGTDYKYLAPGDDEQFGGKFWIYDPKHPEEKYAYVNALTGQSNVRVISSPQLLITTNSQAKISVGDEVPIITAEITNTSSVSAVSTSLARNVTYKQTGINLTVTPRITRGGRINMNLTQEVSEAQTNTTSSIDSPVVQSRIVSTDMSLKNGQLLICGGLIREKVQDNLDSLPLIINIPFIRRLLGDTNISTNRTEMLVLITGTIVTEETELQKLIRGYQSSVDSLVEFSNSNSGGANHKKRFNHSGDLDKWFLE